MTIQYIQGNLFAAKPQVIVHGCNNLAIMGAGFALQLKMIYPKAYEDYRTHVMYVSRTIGTVNTSHQPNGVIVYNAITQTLSDDLKNVYYDGVDRCLETIAAERSSIAGNSVEEFETPISMPKIGAGLGGGHWPVLAQIIAHRLEKFNVHIYHLD